MRLSRLLLAVALFGFLACRESTDPNPGAGATVAKVSNGIRISNIESRAMAYVAFESQYATLVDWLPCHNADSTCLRVPPHSSVTVPYLDIPGYQPGAQEAVIYTWHLRRDAAGAYQVDELQSWRVAF